MGRDRSLAAVAGGVPCHAGAGARGVHAVSRLRAGRDRPDLGQSKRRALEHQSKRLQPERGTFGGVGAERHEPERHAVDLCAAGDGAVAAARRAEREPRHARRGAAEPRPPGPSPAAKTSAGRGEPRRRAPRGRPRRERRRAAQEPDPAPRRPAGALDHGQRLPRLLSASPVRRPAGPGRDRRSDPPGPQGRSTGGRRRSRRRPAASARR